jgi:hypothetical protein
MSEIHMRLILMAVIVLELVAVQVYRTQRDDTRRLIDDIVTELERLSGEDE